MKLYTFLCNDLPWFKVLQLIIYRHCLLTFKVHNGLTSLYLTAFCKRLQLREAATYSHT